MKPTKHCLKKWEGWKMIKGIQWGGEFVQSTLDSSIESSQWNPIAQLMSANKTIAKISILG
jgi:hypothetical protein